MGANAIKDAQGRAELKKISAFNKATLKAAVADAVHKGEQRALQIEKKMKAVNAKTRASMNQKITTEITHLENHIHSEITTLTLETAEARAEMKKEIIFAIKSASEVAAQNLKDTVAWAEGRFSDLETQLAADMKRGKEGRAKMKATIDADKKNAADALDNAVAEQNKALLSYRQEMCEEVGVMGGQYGKHGKAVAKENKDCGGGRLNKKLGNQYEIMKANAASVAKEMEANKQALTASLESARKAADNQLSATSEAAVARYNEVIKAVEDGIDEATKKSDARFVQVYEKMADDAQEVSDNLGSAVAELNEKIAEHAALEDERFSKTVADIKAAKEAATSDVADAKKMMTASIADAVAKLKQVETKVKGDIMSVSGAIIDEQAVQNGVNKRVKEQIDALFKRSDADFSSDKRARGVLKKIMDENKATAAEETLALKNEAEAALKHTRHLQNEHLSGFKRDLTEATEKLYKKLSDDKTAQEEAIEGLEGQLSNAKAKTADALANAEKEFGSRVTTLTNAITANAKRYEENLAHATGLTMDWKTASKAGRESIRRIRDGMVADLNKDIVHAIQIGEAKIKAVEETAMLSIKKEKRALLTTISTSVENMADNVFAAVQENRDKIADNYLSLKAYAGASADLIADYLAKGKGRNLSSIGDLLNTLAEISNVHTKPAEGEGYGLAKIHGLVNEYVSNLAKSRTGGQWVWASTSSP